MSGTKKLVNWLWKRRPSFSTIAEISGFVALVYGVALFSTAIAFIVGGILLIVAGGLAA